MTIHTVVADDHPVTLAGTARILERDARLKVIGEATDGQHAIMLCRDLRPDLLLLDMRLPRLSGLAVLRALRALITPPRVIMLSAYSDPPTVHAALEAGAQGYVLKSTSPAALLAAIHAVMGGKQPVLVGVEGASEDSPKSLSAREIIVLRYVAEGMTSKEIAMQIGVSPRSVETYLRRVYVKMGARNRAEAMTIAQKTGVFSSRDTQGEGNSLE